MAFPLVAMGIGALASGAASLGSSLTSGSRQKKLMDYQYKKEASYQKDMALHNWNNYNSPAAQRRSMEAAGINPFAGDSSVAGMQMSSNSTGPDLQEAADPLGGFASNIQAGASSLFQMSEQKRVNDSIIDMNKANANKAQADANQTNMMLPGNLDLQHLDKQLKTIAGANDALRNQLLAIEAKYKERQTLLGLQQMQQEIDESLSRVQLNSAEQKVKDKMLEQIDASIRLANAQTSTEGAKQRNLDANSRLTDAQRESEDQLREGRIRLTKNQASAALAAAGLDKAKAASEWQDLFDVLTGAKRATSLYSLIDKMSFDALMRLGNGRSKDEVYANIWDAINSSM